MTAIMQKSFSSGELSPSLYARTDVAKYQNALRTCRNFYVMRHGGVSNRPGTQFVGEAKNQNRTVRLIPFVFNVNQTYCLEFGRFYMRVIKNGEYIKRDGQSITGITNANPAVITYSGADNYANDDHILLSGISGPMGNYLNNRQFIVKNVNTTANTFHIHYMNNTNVNSTSFGAYTSGGTIEEIYEITTPYSENDLSELKFVQSADVLTIVHPGHAPQNLSRTGDASWTLAAITFEAQIDYPTSITAVQNGTTGARTYKYTVTAFNPLTGQETTLKTVPPSGAYLATVTNGNATLSSTNSITVSWSLTSLYGFTASQLDFNIYRETNGVFGFIGIASGVTSFVDIGYDINTADTPPRITEDFNASGDYPSAITYYQQRLVLANTNNDIEKVYASKTASFYDFSTSNPIQDDDAIINDYTGDELSIYSSHLVDDYTLLDWAYQQIPHSILWMVRDDGTMLGMTYIREQQMLAWHQHDFENGVVESVCSIPEGSEDTLYLSIRRVVNGETRRYIEKFVTRKISDVRDIAILDSHLSYDGRNTNGSHTMTLSGSGWLYTDTLTLTSSTSYFTTADVGNEIQLIDTDGSVIRFTIDSYTSGTVVTGRPNRTVPTTLRSVAVNEWARAVDVLSGLWHLEGQSVSVYSDGLVVANPNNPAYVQVTVTNGQITLTENYAVIYVGIPITSDIETLNIDMPGSSTMIDRNKLISKVSMFVENTRGLWAGTRPPNESVSFLDGLTELKIREDEPYDSPVDLETDPIDIITEATWNNNGRVFIRQTDPVPCSILSIAPTGYIPFPGGS